MAENLIGLSLDLLIHPGETVKELIEERGMSQEELAIRTGYSAKHISEVVRGKKDISHEFANRLEYALDIPAYFFINLQSNYDKELFTLNSMANIQDSELSVLCELKDIIKYLENNSIIECGSKKEATVLSMRKFLNINDLSSIKSLPIIQAAFRGSKSNKVNPNVLYAWQKLCDYLTKDIEVGCSFDSEKLLSKKDEIKSTMFLDADEMVVELKKIFSDCGIVFEVVRNFPGAPVQGFIQKKEDKMILCMTIRQSFTDIFWFTLFHEIAHLVFGDYSDTYIDFQNDKNFAYTSTEKRADEFARNELIDPNDYKLFIEEGSINPLSVASFAKTQNVLPGIVVGRLQNDTGNYTLMSKLRSRYVWSNEK